MYRNGQAHYSDSSSMKEDEMCFRTQQPINSELLRLKEKARDGEHRRTQLEESKQSVFLHARTSLGKQRPCAHSRQTLPAHICSWKFILVPHVNWRKRQWEWKDIITKPNSFKKKKKKTHSTRMLYYNDVVFCFHEAVLGQSFTQSKRDWMSLSPPGQSPSSVMVLNT